MIQLSPTTDPHSVLTSPAKNRFQRHALITAVMTILVIILLVDVAAASIYWQIAGYPWSERAARLQKEGERRYRIRSPYYHHDLAPNISLDDASFGDRVYPIRTNSFGFKDRTTRTVPLSSNHHRLLFIGDSMTEGVGVEYPSTFVGRVDEALGHQNIEVLNAAVASYCPMIYWRKLKYWIEDRGLKVDEVVVLIDISDAWDDITYALDEHGAVVERVSPEDGKAIIGAVVINKRPFIDPLKHFIRDRTILISSLIRPLWSRSGLRQEEVIDQKARWTFDPKVWDDLGRKGAESMKDHMDRLRLMLQAHNVRLMVGVYPWPDQITHGDLDGKQVSVWKEWCAEHQIPFFNLFPILVKQRTKEEERAFLRDYFLTLDVHWNERGHAIVADAFLDFYKKASMNASGQVVH